MREYLLRQMSPKVIMHINFQLSVYVGKVNNAKFR